MTKRRAPGICRTASSCPNYNFMLIGAAFYHDRYRKTADGWRISETGYDRTYDVDHVDGDLNFKVKSGRALNI